MRRFVIVLAISISIMAAANAGITNGSFESPTYGSWGAWQQASGWNYMDVSGWGGGYYGGGPAHPSYPAAWQPQDGSQYIAIRSYAVWQTTDVQFEAGKTYTIGVWSVQENPRSYNLGINIAGSTDPLVLANGGDAITGIAVEPSTSSMGYFELSYTATAADAGKWVQVVFYENPNINSGLWLDNATLTVIPEPATMISLLVGSIFLARRKK
ncbi:MAG: hypothetical protein A2Y12_10650 [Planctomycetes bacterium GWF2_42_9]|nr:MAG: hypothetical protein A2Y12_10650 [Planctomycetes bacterium GWF2_42_9]